MKRFAGFGALMRLITFPMVLLFVPLMALADTQYVNGRTWTYTISGTAATVTGVSPSAGDLIIPEYLGGAPVRIVAYDSKSSTVAFRRKADIESVVFPPNLTRIDDNAFDQCSNLKLVSYPNSLKTIGASAFSQCNSLEEVFFPETLESFGKTAFYKCENLYGLTLPDAAVYPWGSPAFMYCNAIRKLFLPKNMTDTTFSTFSIRVDFMGDENANITDFYFAGIRECDVSLLPGFFTVHAPWKDGASTSYYDFEYWEPTFYTTYFNANGGSVYQTSKSYPAGIPYGALPAPWKEGYKFDGWYTSSSGGSEVTGQSNVPYSSRTLYAHWKLAPKELTVTFNANGGSGTMSSQTIPAGGSAVLKSNSFTRSGYRFVGWGEYVGEYDEVWLCYEAGDRIYADDYSGAVTLYAVWAKSSITITFDPSGGTVSPTTKTVSFGSSITLPTPSRNGCEFYGWANKCCIYPAGERYTYDGMDCEYDDFTFVADWHELWPSSYRTSFSATDLHMKEWYDPDPVLMDPGGASGIRRLYFITDEYDENGYSTVPDCPYARQGYSFAGWDYYDACSTGRSFEFGGIYIGGYRGVIQPGDKVAICGVSALVATWKTVNYTVTFNANGGSCSTSSKQYSSGSTLGTLPTATRSGYAFDGWYTSSSGGSKVTSSTTVTGTMTLYAHWSKVYYTIIFNANGGSCSTSSKSFAGGSTLGTLPVATRSGYTFDGWYTSSNGGTKVTSSTAVTGSMTLYAHWSVNSYSISFNANGGSCSETSRSREYGSTLGSLPTPSRTGYSFAGWFTSSSGGSQVSSSTTVSGNVTYYAHWTANTYTLTFNANGGSVSPTSRSVTYDSTYSSLPTPTKSHSRFLGWFTSSSGGTQVSSSTRVTGNATVYAHWETQRYTLTFNANGGSCSQSSSSVTYGEAYGNLPTPTRTGYAFAGWYTSSSGGSRVYISTTMTTEGATVYAHWTANTYTVTLDRQGGSGGSSAVTVTYEQLMPAITLPSRDGYAFAGYFSAANGAGKRYYSASGTGLCQWDRAETVTLYAKWTRIPRTVTFDLNDGTGTGSSLTVYHGDACTEYATPAREGYIFTGWYTTATGYERYDKTLPVTADITLYAHWIEDAFTTEWMDELSIDIAAGVRKVHSTQLLAMDPQWAIGGSKAVVAVGGKTVGQSLAPDLCEWAGDAEGIYVASHQVLDANGNPTGESYSAKLQWVIDSAVILDDDSGNPILREYRVGETCELPIEGNKPGYNLVGWSDGKQIYAPGGKYVVTVDDVVLTAVYEVASVWSEDATFSAAVANTYDGYMIDEDYNLLGIVQVKTTKQSSKGVVTATATVTDANGKKWSYSKGVETVEGVVMGLKCTTKDCPVVEFGVKVGKNGLEGEWGEYAIFGARNGMSTKGDPMEAALEHYKGKWSVTLSAPRGEDAAGTVRMQLDVQAKGAVKIAGNLENGAKVSASAQMVMGDGFAYVPVMVKATKTSPALNALLRIAAGGEVSLLGEGELADGGRTTAAIEIVGYLAENPVKAGAAYVGRVALNELAYPAKFTQKGLPTGLKLDAATGVVSGSPTKPGEYEVTFTAASSMNSKSNDTVKVTIKVENYVDGLIPVEDCYGPYTPGVSYTVTIPAADGCTVSGMPTGMKWTAKDVKAKDGTVTTPANSIYGIPTKPDKYTVYFKKTVSELNEKGKSVKVTHTATATFEVADYPTLTLLPSLAIAGSDPVPVADGAALSFFVGVKQSFAIDLAGTLDGVDTTVAAKGLPSGLKLVKKTIYVDPAATKKVVDHYEYVIEGVPTKASSLDKQKNVVPSHVTLTASNKYKWSGTFAFDITVEALPSWAFGTFDGGNTNGMAQLTVSNVGKISGKWMSEGLTWTLSAASYDAYCSNEEKYVATVVGKSGKLVMTNEIEVTEGGVVAYDVRGEDTASTTWEAWRNGWKEEPLKTLATKLKGQKVQVGEVLLTVGASGAVTAKGAFVMGFDEKKQKDITYSASCSTVLIPTAEAGLYRVYLYFPAKPGKFDGFSACEDVVFEH